MSYFPKCLDNQTQVDLGNLLEVTRDPLADPGQCPEAGTGTGSKYTVVWPAEEVGGGGGQVWGFASSTKQNEIQIFLFLVLYISSFLPLSHCLIYSFLAIVQLRHG